METKNWKLIYYAHLFPFVFCLFLTCVCWQRFLFLSVSALSIGWFLGFDFLPLVSTSYLMWYTLGVGWHNSLTHLAFPLSQNMIPQLLFNGEADNVFHRSCSLKEKWAMKNVIEVEGSRVATSIQSQRLHRFNEPSELWRHLSTASVPCLECRTFADCNGRKTSTRVIFFFHARRWLFHCVNATLWQHSHCPVRAFLREHTSVFHLQKKTHFTRNFQNKLRVVRLFQAAHWRWSVE